jgi:hypothetical protein
MMIIMMRLTPLWTSCKSGLFFTGWGSSLPLLLGKNHMVYLQKGKRKLDVNSIFGENSIILKKLSLGKQPYYNPCYRRKKSPVSKF